MSLEEAFNKILNFNLEQQKQKHFLLSELNTPSSLNKIIFTINPQLQYYKETAFTLDLLKYIRWVEVVNLQHYSLHDAKVTLSRHRVSSAAQTNYALGR